MHGFKKGIRLVLKGEKMARKKKDEEKEKRCFKCEETDYQAVLLYCRKKGKDLLVCTRCLPMLIHGG